MSYPPANELKLATEGALLALDSIPRRGQEPVFREPWEAEVFALSLSLHEQGLFTWQEWANTLSATIKTAQTNGDPDLGDTYYLHWLATLEQIVVDKQVGGTEQLKALYAAWDQAARHTEHGHAIELS